MKMLLKAIAPLVLATVSMTAPAQAATTVTRTFNLTGSMPDNGTYGNSITRSSTEDSSLQVKITGWQSNQDTNKITSAYVGAYSPGLGVTGLGDANGGGAYHQIDNAFGYTDFILLQFNRAVTLSGANLNVFQMTNVAGKDSDLSFYDAGALTTAAWDSVVDLSAYRTVPSTWSTVDGGSAGGSRTLGATTASTKWLIGAAFLPATDRDDGFKLQSLSVTTAVPEPASWAMMIVGIGMVGGAMRRSRGARRGKLQLA